MIYMFSYSTSFGTAFEAEEVIKGIPDISSWLRDMSNAIFIRADISAKELSMRIREQHNTGRFIVIEITENRQGWLSKKAWKFIRNNNS